MREKKPGRLAHGYEIRVEHTGQFPTEHHQVWGVEDEMPEEWDQFQQDHVGDPDIHGAQIYRSSECRKNMQHRTILDVFAPRSGNRWQR